MADLRTRIAAVLYIRAMSRLKWHTAWADVHPEVQQMWLADADAVIAELGLKSQWINDGIISDGPPPNWVLPCDIRYTTKWERSE